MRHKRNEDSVVGAVVPLPPSTGGDIVVKFFCKEHSSLRVILKHSQTNAMTGNITHGITAEFINGLYQTSDPETIDLMRKYAGPEYDEVKE